MDLKQVWFAGAHSNIGGSYKPDKNGDMLSDVSLKWMIDHAREAGLSIEKHLYDSINANPLAKLHNSRRNFYRIKKKFYRNINHHKGSVIIHESVKQRWENDKNYRPQNLAEYISKYGW